MIGLCGTIDPVEVPEHHGHFREAGFDPGLPIFLWLWSKGMATEVEDGKVESKQVEESAAMAATHSWQPEGLGA